MNRKNGQSNN